MATEKHSIAREGLVTGFLGATAVAVWFFIVDMIGGRPLSTPNTLGEGMLSVFGRSPESTALNVIAYTVFHYAAFALVGVIAVILVHAGERTASVLAGSLILFVAIELGFYGIVELLRETTLGNFAWYQILAGNLLAAVLMGTYLWRAHPALKQRLVSALDGTAD
ncbi:MAG TPA: hypothetical protein VM076_00710 [Gemmatimonadaceae bacterium]|nr:hypothetical protein [Gemmatimonadaceae bacterium]